MAKRAPAPMKVVASDGSRMTDTQVQEIHRELINIAGTPTLEGLRPKDIVEAAKDPDSPLHRYFTWDVLEAAEKHWLTEARKLVQAVSIRIVTQEGLSANVRTIVSVKMASPDNVTGEAPTYLSRRDALRRKDTRARIAAKAVAELNQWVLRYGDIDELRDLRQSIIKLLGE